MLVARLPRWRRRAALVVIASAIPLGASGWWTLSPAVKWRSPAGLRVTFLDVGQGDAELLEVPEGALLIDTGPPRPALTVSFA